MLKRMLSHILSRYLFRLLDAKQLTALYHEFYALPGYTHTPLKPIYHALFKQGLANSRVIPFNRHQIWPFWVHSQFKLGSPHYAATGFPYIVTNTTQRNWTNIAPIHSKSVAVIDPKGLVSVAKNGWSVDTWLKTPDACFTPAKSKTTKQSFYKNTYLIQTQFQEASCVITTAHFPRTIEKDELIFAKISVKNVSDAPIRYAILIAIRPYNCEGIAPINRITYLTQNAFMINGKCGILLKEKPNNIVCSHFESGDISEHTHDWEMILDAQCPHNLASAYAQYDIQLAPSQEKEIDYTLLIQHPNQPEKKTGPANNKRLLDKVTALHALDFNTQLPHYIQDHRSLLESKTTITTPDPKRNAAFEQSLFHIYSMTGPKPKAGAYTYSDLSGREFLWIGLATAYSGGIEQTHQIIKTLQKQDPPRSKDTYYETTGQLFLLLTTLLRITNDPSHVSRYEKWLKKHLTKLKKTAFQDIVKSPVTVSSSPFSPSKSELSFWGLIWLVTILKSAKQLAEIGLPQHRHTFEQLGIIASKKMDTELTRFSDYHAQKKHLPTTHGRLMDANMLLNLITVYPLKQTPHHDPRILATLQTIETVYCHDGRFFSTEDGFGLVENTLLAHIYTLQRHPKSHRLLSWITDAFSPTGSMPKAIHPVTGGGAVGDGHDLAANAHYTLTIQSQFVLTTQNTLILTPNIPSDWIHDQSKFGITNAHTHFGTISAFYEVYQTKILIKLTSCFHTNPDNLEIHLPITIDTLQIGINKKKIQSHTISIPANTKSVELTFSAPQTHPAHPTQSTQSAPIDPPSTTITDQTLPLATPTAPPKESTASQKDTSQSGSIA